MGKASRVATVLVIFGVMAGPASAQGLQAPSPPAEQPPDSFEGAQFVDSRGCVYVRAGLSGTTTWVPRVNRQRQQVCGAEPTLAAGARPDPQAADAPDRPRTAAAPPTAKGAREPSPEAGGPAPRRRISRSEACAGRSGVQPDMISARTGAPIDCGPAPAAEAPADPRRMTLARICAEQARGDRRFVDARTGRPIVCPAQRTGAAQPARYMTPLDRAPGSTVLRAPPTAARGGGYSNPLDAAPGSLGTAQP